MAASSSDESTGPNKDFHLSSSLDSGSRLSPNRWKCPLCSGFQKHFVCRDCVVKGDFFSSKDPESCDEKKRRLYQLKAEVQNLEERCMPYIEKKQMVDALTSKIRFSKDRIRIIKLALEEKRAKQKINQERLRQLTDSNKILIKSLPKYDERVEKLESYIQCKTDEMQRSRALLIASRAKLKTITRKHLGYLIKYVFPISHIQPKNEMSESGESDIAKALSEATHTTFIKDTWIYTDSSTEYQHSIVYPTLPGSGNYSAYNLWVSQNRDAPQGGSNAPIMNNPAYNISAALTYTAQLVQIIAFYLDVRLPYRMVYSDFCSSDMTEQQFSRRVARLNANILQLCYTQNVNLSKLNARQTLHNVLQLVDLSNPDLGRQGAIEVDRVLANNLEAQISNDLATSEDSDSEEADVFTCDWEAVPHLPCPEVTAGPITQSSQMISTQQTTSMAGGLVTSAAASIASIWRGWTGR